MKSRYLEIIKTQRYLTEELIKAKEHKEGLNFILNNIKNAKTYKIWCKLKKIKLFIKNFYRLRQKPLSTNNIFVTVITYLKDNSFKKEKFIKSIFSQTYPNIELICIVSKKNIYIANKFLNRFKNQKKINIKLIDCKNINLLSAVNQSMGKYICLLKPKYAIDSNYLEKCIIKMELEKLEMCFAEIDIKLKKKKNDFFKKSLINPEYSVITKKYLLSIIKPPLISKITEPLVNTSNNIKLNTNDQL